MDFKSIEVIGKSPNSLDSLAPYVGKMRPELVDWLIKKFAYPQGTIYDPFSGSGTVLLEGWKNGYHVIGSDLNEYAIVLSTNHEVLSQPIMKIGGAGSTTVLASCLDL